MREYGIFHPLALSFFSRSLYRDVAWSWRGLGFLYLLLLLSLSWIPAAVTLHRTVAIFVDNLSPLLLDQFPTITITDGEVSIKEPQPYVIKTPGTGAPLVVIDNTGGTTPGDFPDASVLLTRRQLVWRKGAGETRIYDLSNVRSFTLDRARLESWCGVFRNWTSIALYPFLLLGSYAYRILQVLLYGAIGILFARIEKADLEYKVLVRLSAVAITPAVLLDTLRGWMGKPTTDLWLFVCFAISMGYLFLAVRSAAASPRPEPAAPEAAS